MWAEALTIRKNTQSSKHLVLDIWHGNSGIDLAAWKARHALWAVTSNKLTVQESE